MLACCKLAGDFVAFSNRVIQGFHTQFSTDPDHTAHLHAVLC